MSGIIIYADGGCRGNQNKTNVGGWGAMVVVDGQSFSLYGGERDTTNNKMELTGVIKALEFIESTEKPIKVHCDSAYVVNGMNSWVGNWVKNNWKKSNKKQVENQDLWKALLALSDKQEKIGFIKVRGHAGVELNEAVDKLANQAMDEIEQGGE